MKPRHQVSRTAIDLIKRFEGYRRTSAQLPDGRWTLGYGHTLTARAGAEVSEADAEALLLYDLIAVAHSVNEWTFTPLTQNQFDALCAFAFNIGVDNFRRSSVLRRVNEGQLLQAACAMELWRKADFEGERIVIDALVRRRSAEKTLFLTPANGWVPAPSPILRPNVDMDAAGAVPRQVPTALLAPMDGPLAIVQREEASVPVVEPTLPPPVVIAPDPTPGTLQASLPAEDVPSPTQTAAATVTSRLSTLFRDEPPVVLVPEPVVRSEEAAAAAEPLVVSPPQLVLDPPRVEAPAYVPPPMPPLVMAGGERPFALTSPEPDHEPLAMPERPDLPVAANESHPNLFDLPVANDQLAQPEPPRQEPPRRILIDDTLPYDSGFETMLPEQPKLSLLPLVTLAIAGLAFFAGGLFWAANARGDADGSLLSPANVGWLAGVAGIAFFGIAAYLMLSRLGRADVDDDQDVGI